MNVSLDKDPAAAAVAAATASVSHMCRKLRRTLSTLQPSNERQPACAADSQHDPQSCTPSSPTKAQPAVFASPSLIHRIM